MLFLMQPRRLVAFFAARVHYLLMVNLLSTRMARTFSVEMISNCGVPSKDSCQRMLLTYHSS